MCQAFIPMLKERGRIVNVSSVGSSLQQYSKDLQRRFRSSKMTLGDLETLLQEYQVWILRIPLSYFVVNSITGLCKAGH